MRADQQFTNIASNCEEPAKWQMEHNAVTFCETHKQQMQFVSFKLVETKQSATCAHCETNTNHGLAAKYCNKCKKSLCLNCAFEHVAHGVVDIAKAQKEIAKKIATRVSMLEEDTKWCQTVLEKIHNIVTTMQLVCSIMQ